MTIQAPIASPLQRVKTALDREQVICNLAWDYCTRIERGESVNLQEYLQRTQLKSAADAEEFLTIVNMHSLLLATATTEDSLTQSPVNV